MKKDKNFLLRAYYANPEIINIDDYTLIGDVVIYSAKTKHGVLDIDSDCFPDLNSNKGRYVALTTLFKW